MPQASGPVAMGGKPAPKARKLGHSFDVSKHILVLISKIDQLGNFRAI
jgi:hypothetical protein